MTDDLIEYNSERTPVDEEVWEPLGLAMWAAIGLHSGVRDTVRLDLGSGLSDAPFDLTLGRAIADLVQATDDLRQTGANTSRRYDGRRIQASELRHAAGHLVLASMRRDRCRTAMP